MSVFSIAKAKMSVSTRIRSIAEHKGLNLKELAAATDTSYRTLQNYISDERGVGSEFLAAMSERLGVSASWLLTGLGPQFLANGHPNEGTEILTSDLPPSEHAAEFVAIPRYDVNVSAGYGTLVEAEVGSGHYAYNRSFLRRRGLNETNLSVISVAGDSMEPELYDGDLILIATDQTVPRSGYVFAVHYDGQLFVKRLQHLPGHRLHLISTNDRYPAIIVDLESADDTRIVGRVVASMHEW